MRGVSEVIAIILILMITISLAGLAYMFMSTTMADVTSSAGSTVDTTTSSMLTSFKIETMDISKVYVRNTGQNTITSLSVYVNDVPAHINMTPTSIAPGQIGTITIYDFIMEDDTIKITSPSGFSTTKKAPDPCEKAVGCWKFDEGSGTVAYDSSPYDNMGALVGMETTDWINGKYGKALNFDGSEEYVIVNDAAQYNIADEITIEMIMLVNSQDQDWEDFFYKNGDRLETRGIGNKGIWWMGSSTSNLYEYNRWFQISYVSSFSQNKSWFYVDGVQVSNSPYYTRLPLKAGSIYIGSVWAGESFNGSIDEVRIYNRAIY